MEIITSQNGVSVNGAPLTTSATRTAAPGLLRNAIDDRIVRIRPVSGFSINYFFRQSSQSVKLDILEAFIISENCQIVL